MKYNLSIGAVARNEAKYLAEWIEFHLLQGVEHFYIIEGGSTDATVAILSRYQKAGIVTYLSDPKYTLATQMYCYDIILEQYGLDSEWIAFIDVDEFLYAYNSSLPSFLNPLDCSALAVHWKMYGSNGELLYTPGLTIERFPSRAIKINQHVKSIVRPSCTLRAGGNPHIFKTIGRVIDENELVLPAEYALSLPATASLITINHYHTKTHEEYVDRRDGRISEARIEETFKAHDTNELLDTDILRFASQVKRMMEQRE